MNSTTWLPAAAGLAGALVGAIAVIKAQLIQSAQQADADEKRDYRLAVCEVLVRAQGVNLRANDAIHLAAHAGSFQGAATRTLGVFTPVDLQGIFDRMNVEADALQRAASTIWICGDQRAVELTNAVVIAAMDLVTAHHEPGAGPVRYYARIAFAGRHTRATDTLQAATSSLAVARRELTAYARDRLGCGAVDLWSVGDDQPDETLTPPAAATPASSYRTRRSSRSTPATGWSAAGRGRTPRRPRTTRRRP